MQMRVILAVVVTFAVESVGRSLPTHFKGNGSFEISEYIIGGDSAPLQAWPHQGFLKVEGTSCGLSVISNQWLLTAAHCVDTVSPSQITVGLGYTDKGTSQGKMFKIDQLIVHPEFSGSEAAGDDIALLRLVEPLVFSDNVKPIALAQADDSYIGASDCYITGWGRVNPAVPGGVIDLQQAQVTVFSLQECEEVFGKDHINDLEHVCTGEIGKRGSCLGDSGGPAQCRVNGTWIQFGVASFVKATQNKKCDVTYPSVYTNVGYFRSWVNDNCQKCL